MQRRKPLKAAKGLDRRSELTRGGQLERKSPMPQQSAKKRAERRTWEQFRKDVYARAEGVCDMCATWINWDDYECHHRRLRGQGGRNEMANLVALHKFPCHARAHDNRAWAKEKGFIVHRPDKPTETPVLRHLRSRQLPGETWTPVDPEEMAA